MIVDVIMELLGIIILWLSIIIIILIHEMGHMAGYKLAKGDDDWSIIVGVGKRILKTKHLVVHIIPWSGMFQWQKRQPFTNNENILISAGGPFFSLMLALIIFIFQSVVPEGKSIFVDNFRPINISVRNYNIVILLMSMIPINYPSFIPLMGNHPSDGMTILKLLYHNKKDR